MRTSSLSIQRGRKITSIDFGARCFAKKRARRTKRNRAETSERRRSNCGVSTVRRIVGRIKSKRREYYYYQGASNDDETDSVEKEPPPSSLPDVDDGDDYGDKEVKRSRQENNTPYVKKAKRLILGEYKVPHFSAIAVGQFRPEKNHKLLLESWKLMKTNVKTNKHPACEKAVLKLVGGLRDKNDLRRYNALKRWSKKWASTIPWSFITTSITRR